MVDKPKVLAIIPARKGSKRLPNKNMLQLAGKPLIQWTIEAAQQSEAVDELLVTSDDPTVLDLAASQGARHIVDRPAEFASDEATTSDTIRHAIEVLEHEGFAMPDTICLLQATSPLRNAYDIDAAFDLYSNSHAPAVISVCELSHPLKWCGTLDETLSMKRFAENVKQTDRCEGSRPHYRLNGAIYISKLDRFRITGEFLSINTLAYIMPPERSVDIDNRFDFLMAESLADRAVSGY